MDEEDDLLPPPPTFDDETIRQCEQDKHAMPMVFEWYRYTGMISGAAASVLPEAPGLRTLPQRNYLALTGLLLRCSQLMRASVELAAKHRFGDALRILARSISESAVKVMWLCHHGDDATFRRYIADGLKADLEFRKHIEANIRDRGHTLVIEQRMMESVRRFVAMSGLTDADIETGKNLPDVVAMYEQIGGGRPLYVVVQKFGSHATHGTWLDLAVNYLTMENDLLSLNYDYVLPDEDSLRMTALLVLDAVLRFLSFVHPPGLTADYIRTRADIAQSGLLETMKFSYGGDFDAV